MPEAPRPDPDLLLQQVKEAEDAVHRARLRIFFGFAPGVGKTYRMLQVAREQAAHGTDVVLGVVETHKRAETAALVAGLPELPRRSMPYHGHVLEEFDLDAALARKPKLLLVDELAHTNAAGSRHTKRWQDVLELLDAGIDVFTTVNVQHVESLNDVVAQITHVQVRETIPDSMLDRADEMELVDISPEELLQRMKEGKVYLPEQAQRAAQHFFQRGNLLALRELALRRTAQHVDTDVLEYRELHGVAETWPTSERLLVCVGPAPSSGHLLRVAYRMAMGLRCPWVAAYVDKTTGRPLSDRARDQLDAHLALAESLGATVTRLSGAGVADSLLLYARRSNVTRILIGKPTHARWRDRLGGSLLDAIVRGSEDIDVHVISGQAPDAPGESRQVRSVHGVRVGWEAYVASTLAVLGVTAVSFAIRAIYPLPDLEVLYLLAVMFSAVRYGRWPSILTAFLSVASYDFFFVQPYYTFAVDDVRYMLTFGLMFGVGILLSELTARIRRQEQDAILREQRTAVLYTLSRELGTAANASSAAETVARHASQVFDASVFVLRPTEGSRLAIVGCWPRTASLDVKESSVAQWAHDHGRTAGRGTATLPGSKMICIPLRAGAAALGVLALEPRTEAPLHIEEHEFLDAFTRQAAYAFDRERLTDEARGADVRAKTEEMRSALLSAVSHDLRTPLAAITAAATYLRDEPGETVREDFLETICDEAERLEHLVANLLEMTRLSSGTVSLKRAWVPLDEMVSSALTRLERVIGPRPVTVDIASDFPLLSVDPVLFEQVFVNLFENAAKYTPEGSPLVVSARRGPEAVTIDVRDHGTGLELGTEQQIFDRFYRGAHPGIRGVGLGLPICRAIVETHGGTIRAENCPDGGALFRIMLPLAPDAPSVRGTEAT